MPASALVTCRTHALQDIPVTRRVVVWIWCWSAEDFVISVQRTQLKGITPESPRSVFSAIAPGRTGEFSAVPGEIPQSPRALELRVREILAISATWHRPAWPASCPYLGERSVFRAAVLSIVLTLAIGPNATLLCSVWCHPDEATTSACQHQDVTSSPQVTGEDSCRTAPTSTTAFVREEAKRTSPTPIAQQAVASPRFRLGPPPTDTLGAYEAKASLSAVASPLLIALRI
jgi:hypothetical protein